MSTRHMVRAGMIVTAAALAFGAGPAAAGARGHGRVVIATPEPHPVLVARPDAAPVLRASPPHGRAYGYWRHHRPHPKKKKLKVLRVD